MTKKLIGKCVKTDFRNCDTLEDLKELVAEYIVKYGDDAKVYIDCSGDGWVTEEIMYYRQETDEECQYRLALKNKQAITIEQQERAMLAELKAKYETKISDEQS